MSEFPDGIASAAVSDQPADAFFSALAAPTGMSPLPPFEHGWNGAAGEPQSHLTYVDFSGSAWSDDLEELHEESSREHFMDVMTRQALLSAVASAMPPDGVVADLGCSTGYLLEDLERAFPDAQLVGVDVVAAGLRKAHRAVPKAALLLADVCDLPIGTGTVQAVVSANMLEHVAGDVQALTEVRRILAPGGVAALVVPYGRNLYDYYDRFLGHERRYGRGELAGKARQAGLDVVSVGHLGQSLYAPFWAVKKRNRLRHDDLRGEQLQKRVEADIAATTNSRLGALACTGERWLTKHGVTIPVGIREIVVVRRPAQDS